MLQENTISVILLQNLTFNSVCNLPFLCSCFFVHCKNMLVCYCKISCRFLLKAIYFLYSSLHKMFQLPHIYHRNMCSDVFLTYMAEIVWVVQYASVLFQIQPVSLFHWMYCRKCTEYEQLAKGNFCGDKQQWEMHWSFSSSVVGLVHFS